MKAPMIKVKCPCCKLTYLRKATCEDCRFFWTNSFDEPYCSLERKGTTICKDFEQEHKG